MPLQTCALPIRSEEHTSELQSHDNLVCRLLREKKKAVKAARAVGGGRGRGGRGLGPEAPGVQLRTATRHTLSPAIRGAQHVCLRLFFFNDTAPTDIYPLPLHAALPI